MKGLSQAEMDVIGAAVAHVQVFHADQSMAVINRVFGGLWAVAGGLLESPVDSAVKAMREAYDLAVKACDCEPKK